MNPNVCDPLPSVRYSLSETLLKSLSEEVKAMSIVDLWKRKLITPRVAEGLLNSGYEYIFELVERPPEDSDLLKMPNFGRKSLKELIDFLEANLKNPAPKNVNVHSSDSDASDYWKKYWAAKMDDCLLNHMKACKRLVFEMKECQAGN